MRRTPMNSPHRANPEGFLSPALARPVHASAAGPTGSAGSAGNHHPALGHQHTLHFTQRHVRIHAQFQGVGNTTKSRLALGNGRASGSAHRAAARGAWDEPASEDLPCARAWHPHPAPATGAAYGWCADLQCAACPAAERGSRRCRLRRRPCRPAPRQAGSGLGQSRTTGANL